MIKLTENELTEVVGGVNITGAFIDAVLKGVNIFLDLGRYLGTAIRNIVFDRRCPF